MSAQSKPTQHTAPDVRLLDDFSVSLAKLKAVATIFHSAEFQDGLDQDILLGLDFLVSDILKEQERIFRTMEGA